MPPSPHEMIKMLDDAGKDYSNASEDRNDNNNGTPYDNNNDSDNDSIASSDEAMLEMLGLSSLKAVTVIEDEDDGIAANDNEKHLLPEGPLPQLLDDYVNSLHSLLHPTYQKESMCLFPSECSISAEYMRKLTEELVWGGPSVQADRSYETIQMYNKKNNITTCKTTLTRLEHFVVDDAHSGWSDLCHNYLRRLLSAVLGTEMVLFKEKLNLKPPGGSGFAPHLDSPSLRVALGERGPRTFCTVMVAIDDATARNGCLRVCKGNWSEEHSCAVVPPEQDGNPDAGGRAGAIPSEVADELVFDDVLCKGGNIVAFNGWAPHRSGANLSPFPRRAVFLTYNPKSEGDYHREYYQHMENLRNEWREKIGLATRQQRLKDEKVEQDALSTIPQI